MPLNVVVLGAPGAGKGTQADVLAPEWGIPKISTGDALRSAIAAGTPLGRSAAATLAAGHFLGDDVMIALVAERLRRPDTAAGFVLDGFPRTLPQGDALEGLMAGRGPLVIVHLAVPPEELVRRLVARRVCGTCGVNRLPDAAEGTTCRNCGGSFVRRSDDDEAVVRERLVVFREQTEPLVEFYRARPTCFEVDGDGTIGQVSQVLRGIVARATAEASAGQVQ